MSRPVPHVRPAGRATAWGAAKRLIDFVVAGLLLVVLAPVLAAIALAVKLTSAGPVIFRQVRYGRDATPFTVFKFRTMWQDAPAQQHEAFIEELAQANGNRSTALSKLDARPLLTPVGGFLRKTSLDELPQLVNVLLGSMSLVGPRPVPLYEPAYYRPQDFDRFRVRPGITGLWQVSGRSELGFYEMLDLDTDYARRSSLGLDLRIALRTPAAVLEKRTA